MKLAGVGAVLGLFLVGCNNGGGSADTGPVSDSARAREAAPADLARTDLPGDAGGAPTCLGTKYPGKGTIDPDNPDFEDALWTKAEVQQKFAAAKAQGLAAYRAYKAAQRASGVLDCAFCTCGCAASDGHLSAIDCFKDMHGFG